MSLRTDCESEVCAEILRGKDAQPTSSAALSALVVLIAAITKLTRGAWVVVVLVPVIVRACRRARTHYKSARKALTPPLDAGGEKRPVRVAPPRLPSPVSARLAEAQDDPLGFMTGSAWRGRSLPHDGPSHHR